LFDEDVPRQLRRVLPAFDIRMVQEHGWSALKSGELLRVASLEFDVFLMADRNLQYQQNIPKFGIGVVVLALRDSRLPSLESKLADIETALQTVEAGAVIRIMG
jgi:hypothetical protein